MCAAAALPEDCSVHAGNRSSCKALKAAVLNQQPRRHAAIPDDRLLQIP